MSKLLKEVRAVKSYYHKLIAYFITKKINIPNPEKALFNLGQLHAGFIAQEVIEQLITLTGKEFLLSGDDSGLKNVWEEICVQVQGEYSFYWDAYEITMEEQIISIFEERSEFIQQVVGYWARQNDDSLPDEEIDEDYFDLDQCVRGIKEFILSDAEDYTNQRIEKYLNEELEDWDVEDDDKENDDADWDDDQDNPEDEEEEDEEDSVQGNDEEETKNG